MEFLWQELPVDPRYRYPASSTDTPLSSPIMFGPALRGQQQNFRPSSRVDRSPSLHRVSPGEIANPAGFESYAAFVQYSLAVLNDQSVEIAIDQEFQRSDPMVQQIMRQHRNGGLLAAAGIIVHWDPAQALGPADPTGRPPATYFGGLAKRFGWMDIAPTVYALPEHAFWQWKNKTRLEVSGEAQYVEHKFFWGTWWTE